MKAAELPERDQDPHHPGKLQAALSRAEHAEALYKTLVERLPTITYTETIDEGNVLSISPQVQEVLGYSQEEWMGSDVWTQILHPDDRKRVVTTCHDANRARRPYRDEYRMLAKDGHVVWIRDEAEIVWSSDGQPLCWQGVMTDVTSQKQAR
ncbi:MAG: PAS domain-containing protein [Actinomycetota bacterium]